MTYARGLEKNENLELSIYRWLAMEKNIYFDFVRRVVLKKTLLALGVLSFIFVSCSSTPIEKSYTPVAKTALPSTPVIAPTPSPSPTPFLPFWKDSPLIDAQTPVVFSNETQEYQGREIYASNIVLNTDTRWTIGIEVNKLAEDVDEASTGIILLGYNKSGIKQLFVLVYQWGNWSVGYQPDHSKDFTYWHTLENLRHPVQNFELSISGDGQSISLTNDKGLNFNQVLEEKIFDGTEYIVVTTQMGAQTELILSELIISQLEKDDTFEAPDSPIDLSTLTPAITENGAPQYIFHVATDGNDNNPGTEEEPFATIERARDIIQTIAPNMENSIVVYIRGGTYPISQPVIFTPKDSGQNGYDIIYRAAENEKPVFSGGVTVSNWAKVPDSPLWRTILPDDTETFRQVYVNGIRTQRASSENTIIGNRWEAGEFSDRDGISVSSTKMPDFSRPQDLELHWIYDWKDMRLLVDDITVKNEGTKIIWMKQPYYLYALWMGGDGSHGWIPKYSIPFYLENAFELLDKAGEWYFNPDTNELFYLPREGEDMSSADVVIPQTQSLFEISGGLVGDEVHNLVFDGLSFEYAGWTRASEQGVYGWQAQDLIADTGWGEDMTPAHVKVNSAHDIRIERCRFEHLGAVGLHIDNNVSDILIQGNLFHDISDGAIVVGNWGHAYITAPVVQEAPHNNLIANNLITDVGVEYWGAPAITAYYVNYLQINHNEITNISYSGISLGWGWSYTLDSVTSHDNLVANNLITDLVLRGRDAGGIYTLGQQPRTVIDSNIIRRMKNDNACLYTDEGSAYITLQNNICDSAPQWLSAWINTIHDNHIVDTYTNVQQMINRGVNIQIENTVYVHDQDWPLEAQAIIENAGLEATYSYLYDWIEE